MVFWGKILTRRHGGARRDTGLNKVGRSSHGGAECDLGLRIRWQVLSRLPCRKIYAICGVPD